MSDPLKDAFIQEAAQDLIQGSRLTGAPDEKQVQEAVRRESPSLAAFADIASQDLQHGERLVGNDRTIMTEDKREELKNAFAQSVSETKPAESEPVKKELIGAFKESADAEAQDVLSKMLKGMR